MTIRRLGEICGVATAILLLLVLTWLLLVLIIAFTRWIL